MPTIRIPKLLYSYLGDSINLMLAAAAFNFKKWIREVQPFVTEFLLTLFLKTTT